MTDSLFSDDFDHIKKARDVMPLLTGHSHVLITHSRQLQTSKMPKHLTRQHTYQ